jgi:cyclopropane fatty-acyl-phospholipid synthase-like methyltransferase
VLAADELDLFGMLARRPATPDDVHNQLKLPMRSVRAMLGALAAGGFLRKHGDRFHLTDVSRTYLLKGSEFYWVPMLTGVRVNSSTQAMLDAFRTENLGPDDRTTVRWERGEMSPEDARTANQRFHSHSMPAAVGLARNNDLSGVQRLLDVAGGSGCYAIQLALRNPHLRCTVADLPVVAADTQSYIARYGCADRVDTVSFNMFDDAWPSGYDAIFFSNVFHDWDPRRVDDLTRRAFEALPSGGRILLHEMLFDDSEAGPQHAALFSIMMLNTRGKQFSFVELAEIVTRAGFAEPTVNHSYGYYSLVTALKP